MNDKPQKLFPLFITKDLRATRAYYVERLGCAATFDLDGYLQVRFGAAEDGPELCFMPKEPETPPPFAGQGVIISVPVDDADRACVDLKRRGVAIAAEPADKPWGWRSFHAIDPNGVVLDFFHVLPGKRGSKPGVDAQG